MADIEEYLTKEEMADIGLEPDQVKVLKGHSDYVNTCVYEPETGDQLLTGSDDHTVKMWEAGDCVSTLHFKSPVMTVAWHTEEVGKVLIGQKSGVISLYNAVSLQPIMSLDCSLSPLLNIDWSESNSLHVSAVVSSELVEAGVLWQLVCWGLAERLGILRGT